MKYLDEYRDRRVAAKIVAEVRRVTTRPWTLMEVCGGQTHSIVKHGIDRLLPAELELVHGPGCPVCVTPLEQIDKAHAIARTPGVIFTSFGDMLRVPGSQTDLLRLKSAGADVRIVYAPLDAVRIAQDNPGREVVFFAVGFETTAPANALAVTRARALGVDNFSMLVSHVLVPPAMTAILQTPGNRVLGFLGPGHVCTVITSTGSTLRFPSGRANCNLREDNAIQTTSRSWYDGLQVNVQKRLSHGLEFQSAYTYSNNLDTTQGRLSIDSEAFTPYVPRNFDKGRSVVNATHNWRFNTLYTFPARQSQGLVSKLVNGWSMQNIVSAQTGFAFTPAAPGDVSLNTTTNINSGYERPELVTSANLGDVTSCVGTTGLSPLGRQCNVNAVVYNPAKVISGDPNRWFNPNMFTTPIPGYLGNVARGSLTGPGLFNWDFSLHKNTPLGFLGETGNLQFRAEFFNILNRANFINNPSNGNGIVGPNAGRLTAARDGRDIQLALKVSF